jgi:hypothetical protein
VVLAEPRCPAGKLALQPFKNLFSAIELDAMALAVVETDGLDELVALKRPREARGRVLSAGKKDQRAQGVLPAMR